MEESSIHTFPLQVLYFKTSPGKYLCYMFSWTTSEILLVTISDTSYFNTSVFETVYVAQGSFKFASHLLRLQA